jgi:cob(I)alamin adenosyltransferase
VSTDEQPQNPLAAQRVQLEGQVGQLQAFLDAAAARGEDVPPEASAMLERLREIVTALHRLSASIGEAKDEPPASNANG